MGILSILGMGQKEEASEELGALYTNIERLLHGKPQATIKMVAGYAGVMGKVAYADMDISEQELERIRGLLLERLSLSRVDADCVVSLLGDNCAQLYSLEDYLYTRMLNDVLSRQQKLELLTALFAVAAANRSISNLEDNAVRVISKGLLLSHKDFIDARLEYREHLAVLK